MLKTNSNNLSAITRNLAIVFVLIGMCIILTIISDNFATPLNIVTVLRQISILGILAIGATFVLVSGGIDLSVGSIVAVSGVCSAMVATNPDLPILAPILIAILIGGAIGLMNGFVVAYARVPAFIMTLGFMIAGRGLALLISSGRPIFGVREDFMGISGTTVFRIGNVPFSTLIFYYIAVLLIGLFILNRTVYGKWVYAVGGNEIASRFSGIKTKRVTMSVYLINGLLAGLCGVLLASRINSGDPTVADTLALDAISAAVIGGVSLAGGVGKIWKVVIGTLIIGIMQNGLQIIGMSSFVQSIIQGIIIVIAVFIDMNMQQAKKQ